MKVIVDANIWISFLLSRGKDNTIYRTVQLATKWPFQLIVPKETISEITNSIARSDYLTARISESEVVELLTYLTQVATIPLSLQDEQERVVRDPRDDYLVAYGLIYGCDYLVTGDADLLVMERIRELQIVSAAQFVNQPPSWNN